MREPKVNDAWRRIIEKEDQFQVALKTLRIEELGVIKNQTVSFNGQLIAVCGKNGVGKSTLLNALIAILKPQEYFSNSVRKQKIKNANFNLSFNNEKGETINTSFSQLEEGAQNYKTTIIDPPTECVEFMKMFSEIRNLEEVTEPLSPKYLKKNELEELKYILNKNIKSCKIYEIELDDSGKVYPYFKIEVGSEEYGLELMGLGEIAAIYIFWNLIIAEKNSFLLLEEPETFLSYTAQEHLINIIADYTFRKKLSTLMTTHSHAIINKIPANNIVFVSRNGKNVNARTEVRRYDYLKGLGMKPEIPYVFCVEDEVARVLLMKIFNKFEINRSNDYIIFAVGGVENVKDVINFPKLSIIISEVIGIFDADQKGKVKGSFKRPYLYLPGEASPEEQFYNLVNDDVNEASRLLGIEYFRLGDIIGRLEGRDYHDWLQDLSNEVGLSVESVIEKLLEGFLEKEYEAYVEFIDEVSGICKWSTYE